MKKHIWSIGDLCNIRCADKSRGETVYKIVQLQEDSYWCMIQEQDNSGKDYSWREWDTSMLLPA